jgi:nanoRNase/pAp phosphatase (c-di-AMP/oligoRNAs hydrolase)
MRFVVLCQYRSTIDLVGYLVENPEQDVLFLVEEKRLERHLQRQKMNVMRGRFRDAAFYDKVGFNANDVILVHFRQEGRIRGVLQQLAPFRNGAATLVFHLDPPKQHRLNPARFPWVQFLSLGTEFAPVFKYHTRLARTKESLRKIDELFEDAKNVLILMQDDPDPDALGSALALRTLIGRKKNSAPIASFGTVSRPENVAMVKLLDIEVKQVTEKDLGKYDRIALVDTQPPHLRRVLPRVDFVVDHHPAQPGYEAAYVDIRTPYGSTSTIFVEYLRARGEKISERLATALLYGVRTDTLLLERGVNEWDIQAFTFLFPLANNNIIRRIERPELPRAILDSFSRGLQTSRIEDKVIFTHLGSVKREDVIPQLAEFCLQIEGLEWSLVSGVIDKKLVMSIRNVGFVRAAGEVVKEAFDQLGSAGGHRAMAKAVIPLESLGLTGSNAVPDETLLRKVEDMFLKSLRGGAAAKA